MAEFQEIAHSGGKLELLFQEPDSVALQFSSGTAGGMGLFQVGVSLDGKILEYWPIRGMDMREPEPPSSMVPAFIISDRERLYGRTCPKCRSYFRTSSPGKIGICPYCAHRDRNIAFTTKNQLQFINKIRESFIAAFKEKHSITIDLDKLADELPENRPAWVYSEERQQNAFQCPNCKTNYDILGEYAGCPNCGKRNSLQVFERRVTEVEQQFTKADAELTVRHEREVEWEKLTRCISDFEAMARDIQSQLLLLPATPKRKKDIESLSFQSILKANDCLREWFGFEMLFHFSDEDKIFLNRMFNRRHILIHNGGRIDQKYLDNTGDTSVRLNQQIVVRSSEIRRLIPLLKKCAEYLFQGFESINY
jgi:uncharacterized Zn finger protein (UPF0148 family)